MTGVCPSCPFIVPASLGVWFGLCMRKPDILQSASFSCARFCVYASNWYNLYFSWSGRISKSFIQGAGGLVNLVRLMGACLSRHSRVRLLRVSTFSSGSSRTYTISKGRVEKSSMKACSLNLSFLRNLYLGLYLDTRILTVTTTNEWTR